MMAVSLPIYVLFLFGIQSRHPFAPDVFAALNNSRLWTKGALFHKRRMNHMSERKSPEQQRFDGALKSILQVSKTDMQKMLEDERKAHEGQPKRGPKPKGMK
jgi:hypothetical protein